MLVSETCVHVRRLEPSVGRVSTLEGGRMVIMESEYGSSFRPVRGGGRIVVPVGAVTDSFGPPLCRGVTPFLLRVNKTVTLSRFFP